MRLRSAAGVAELPEEPRHRHRCAGEISLRLRVVEDQKEDVALNDSSNQRRGSESECRDLKLVLASSCCRTIDESVVQRQDAADTTLSDSRFQQILHVAGA